MRKHMNVTLYRPAVQIPKKLFGPAVIGAGGTALAAASSFADAAAMSAAADVSAFDANPTTVPVALIGISLMGAAYVCIKRALPGRF